MNSKLQMFCLTLNPKHLKIIQKLNYIPVGLGDAKFEKGWLQDKIGKNIAFKNKFYGEYTFHYWLWTNKKYLDFNGWFGFCQYRKFWKINKNDNNDKTFENLNSILLKDIPSHFNQYETIIGENLYVNNFHLSKFLKNNFKNMIKNPTLFINKNKRNIKFHFDMMHGNGNLEKAISLLNSNDKNDFYNYVNSEVSFSPHNMFICKKKEILFSYYESIFPWLEKCEKIFGLENTDVYGLKRMYGFLAERYMSYWFKKNTKHTFLPIHFKDITDYL